jgi:hypothetical protein
VPCQSGWNRHAPQVTLPVDSRSNRADDLLFRHVYQYLHIPQSSKNGFRIENCTRKSIGSVLRSISLKCRMQTCQHFISIFCSSRTYSGIAQGLLRVLFTSAFRIMQCCYRVVLLTTSHWWGMSTVNIRPAQRSIPTTRS